MLPDCVSAAAVVQPDCVVARLLPDCVVAASVAPPRRRPSCTNHEGPKKPTKDQKDQTRDQKKKGPCFHMQLLRILKGLRCRISPTCTLSQNGYGEKTKPNTIRNWSSGATHFVYHTTTHPPAMHQANVLDCL